MGISSEELTTGISKDMTQRDLEMYNRGYKACKSRITMEEVKLSEDGFTYEFRIKRDEGTYRFSMSIQDFEDLRSDGGLSVEDALQECIKELNKQIDKNHNVNIFK